MTIIASEMVIELTNIFEKRTNDELKIKKNEFKIIIDSLTEQIIHYIFNVKPNGIMNARKIINEFDLSKLTYENRLVAESLNEVLKEYPEVFTRKYIDISDKINAFIDNVFLILSKSLTSHKTLKNDTNAKKLIRIIS